jgi:hypothetical protein
VEEVDRQQAAGLGAQEGAPGVVVVGRWRDPVGAQDFADVSASGRFPVAPTRHLAWAATDRVKLVWIDCLTGSFCQGVLGKRRSRTTERADITLLYNLASSPSISVTPLFQESLWAVAPPTVDLVQDNALTWAHLTRRRLVLSVAGHGLRTLMDQALHTAGVEPAIACQTNSMLVQKKLVATADTWTVLPAAGVAEDVAAGRLNGGPLAEPEVSRAIVLALQRGNRVPPAVEVVASEVVRMTRRLVDDGTWPTARIVAQLD